MSTQTLAALTPDDLAANPAEHLRRLQQSGRPETLIVHGHELIVQDAAAYDRLWEAWDRLDCLEKMCQAVERLDRGEGMTLEESRRRTMRHLAEKYEV